VNKNGSLSNGADLVHIARRTVEVIRYVGSPFAVIGDNGWPIESHEIGQFPDYQPRLLRRSVEIHWVQSPHRCAMGCKQTYNLDPTCYIEHYEKDDFRDRDWIEKRWLRPVATRMALGLTCDLYPTSAKKEYAEAADASFWKDGRK